MPTGDWGQPWEKRISVRSQNRVRIGDDFSHTCLEGPRCLSFYGSMRTPIVPGREVAKDVHRQHGFREEEYEIKVDITVRLASLWEAEGWSVSLQG